MSEGALFQPSDLIAGRYRLMRLIGSGAMGMVWSARNESTDRDFALKLMLPSSSSNPARLQRFFQEAKACGRLRHRCIVEVYDLGRIESIVGKPPDPHAGTPYIVMELLEGEPLDSFCRRLGALPIGTALRIIADVSQGLE
ncbi:MAG: protein kinase, partial [Polyangiales bacterium]